MENPHILVLPYPAQGHVKPLMELSECLVTQGFKITFVNTEYNHLRVVNALANKDDMESKISLVSIPDGMEQWEDRNQLGKLTKSISDVMPGKLEELIEKINGSDSEQISCVIADVNMGWSLEVAAKMGIKTAAFWPAAASLLAVMFSVQKLIGDGIIDHDGTPIKPQIFQLAPNMPAMETAHFAWACIGDLPTNKIIFNYLRRNNKAVELADWLFCNTAYELESPTFDFAPKLLPIGPLMANHQLGKFAGNFWAEDPTCLKWLDQQPPGSVIYVAFGSYTVLNQTQFQELALGLEVTKRPFLWVVRPDFTKSQNEAYPDGFLDRVGKRGQMVSWAPQKKVLGHPSVACFLSHCGWNSTMEGLTNGVPFLCWPYFADQFLNETYICDAWEVGLRFKRNENGIISGEEIKEKVERLLGDGNFKVRASNLKKLAVDGVGPGGCSNKVMQRFVEWLKE